MTTEDDFHTALDANPDDWQTRLVFADWLDEHGDPRAEGYRALGTRRRRPRYYSEQAQWYSERGASGNDPESDLPDDWFTCLTGGTRVTGYWHWPTVRAADDAAALAFAKLPAQRRAELLTHPAAPRLRRTRPRGDQS